MSVAAEGVTIAFEPSAMLALQGVLVAVVVGVIAGLAPGWQAARTEIVSALRHA
jgi:ABC-type antimicrobial peptide transport system permease subunit